jgi:HEAT repeat protein
MDLTEIEKLAASEKLEERLKSINEFSDLAWEALYQISLLLDHQEPGVRAKAIHVLSQHRFFRKNNSELLLTKMQDQNAEVRRRAVSASGWTNDKVYIEPLLAMLKDANENYNVRYYAALSIGELKDERVIPELIECLKQIDNHIVISGIILAFGDLKARETKQLVIDALDRESEIVKGAALRTLKILGDEEALPKLYWLVENDHTETWEGKISELAKEVASSIERKETKQGSA